MTKRISLVFASVAVVAAPFLSGFAAGDAAAWAPVSTTQAWEYGSYRVDRLSGTSDQLVRFGDHLVLASRAASCTDACAFDDLAILTNGGWIKVTNVPSNAVDAALYERNGDRFVYATISNADATRVDVVEIDLATGQQTTLLKNVFITNISSAVITVDGDMIYATATLAHNAQSNANAQTEAFAYNARYGQFKQLYNQYFLQNEQIMDVQDGKALIKMSFPNGDQQLWVYDYVEFGEQQGNDVPGSWTAHPEHIDGAHFTDNGGIEFFGLFTRHLTDADLKSTSTSNDHMDWYRTYNQNDLSNMIQVVGGNMAFVTPEGDLYVSQNGTAINKIGNVGLHGAFHLESDRILWSDGMSTGGISTLTGTLITSIDFMPYDMLDNQLVVGSDVTGKVKVLDLATGDEETLGFGARPMISDATHVYWVGVSGEVYQATLYPASGVETVAGTPIKTADSVKVYLLKDGVISYIPNESIYYSWFPSFANVVLVSNAQLVSYKQATAVSYKPGTELRLDGGSKIYLVGADGQLHWIVSGAVAEDILGPNWNQKIVDVKSADVLLDSYGTRIDSANDLGQIMITTN